MFSNKLIFSILIVLYFIIFVACSSDNSVKNDDDNKKNNNNNIPQAVADNNMLEGEENSFVLSQIGLHDVAALNNLWFFVYSEDFNTLVHIKVHRELPTGPNSSKFEFVRKVVSVGEDGFSMEIKAQYNNSHITWVETEEQTGTLYAKHNSNNTITYYFNNITLANKNKMEQTKTFSATITFDKDIPPDGSGKPPMHELKNIE